MTIIQNQLFSGERPLYESRDLQIAHITIGEGESGLKECRHIEAQDCRFEGKYILWECEDVTCRNCRFEASSRASIWYDRDLRLYDCLIDAPKAFREVHGFTIERMHISDGDESFWHCEDGRISDLRIDGGIYAFMHTRRLQITNLQLRNKYIFQYAKNIEIHHAKIDTKDAFWESENCTVYDSEISGEYLGWYSRNLRLVRCRISGTQPLCYCENLVVEDCSFAPDADRAFERSSVRAAVCGKITSVVNPLPVSEITYK